MNLSGLHAKLIAVARANPPSERVPYAFEKRVMARLSDRRMDDAWTLWGAALWRSAFVCVALAVGLSIWSLQAGGDISTDLDSAMVAGADQLVESW
jgi:hypothetical protein